MPKDIVKSYLQEVADGIETYGFNVRAGIVEFYCWILYAIVNHPNFSKYGRDLEKIYGEIMSAPQVKKSFEKLGQNPPQLKTLRNKMPFFEQRVLPSILDEKDFKAGFERSFTDFGTLLLRGETKKSPDAGDNCRHCKTHCPKNE